VLVWMVILSHHAGQFRVISESATAAIVLVLSALMVSRVRFRSFKDLRWSRRTAGALLLVGGVYAAIVYAGLHRASIFLLLVTAYIALGLAEEVIFFRSRRAEARASRESRAAEAALVPAREEEVLRELGAFDNTEEEAPAAGTPEAPATKGA
jgi:CDP-diacylglycerol--serine O-phosphatidyltransferase